MAPPTCTIVIDSERKKTFFSTLKPLLVVNRIFGLLPTIVIQNSTGKFEIRLSRTVEIYSCIFVLLLYIYLVFMARWVLSQRTVLAFLIPTYYYSRFTISALMHTTCLYKRHIILRSLQAVADLETELPKRWVHEFVYAPIMFTITLILLTFPDELGRTSIMFDVYFTATFEIIPTVVLLCVCSEFNWKVSVLHLAIIDLNGNLKTILKESSPLKPSSLRPIMRRHQKLREVCEILNHAYGTVMLFAMAAVFCEVTYCLFYFSYMTKSLNLVGNIITLLWSVLLTVPCFIVLGQCQRTESEANQTESLSCDTKGMELEETFKNQIEICEWGVQLKQLPLRFAASNLFDLNRSQLKTIICTIISYFVILLQSAKYAQ